MSVQVDGLPVRYDRIPGTSPYMRAAAERWVEHGSIDQYDFLWAVVTNDLELAVRLADDENIRLLPEWVRWFHNHAPTGCWGSRERARDWAAARAEACGDCGGGGGAR